MKLQRKQRYEWENAIDDLLYEMEGNVDYLKGASDFLQKMRDKKLLPSGYQLGDLVSVDFKDSIAPSIPEAKVIKIHFAKRKVTYDVEVPVYVAGETYQTRFYNLDSAFIKPVII